MAKWRKWCSMADLPTGPKHPHSTVLTIEQEAIIFAFRRHTLLLQDDCLYGLQATIPHLTRSSLHRCLERHGINRLPEVERDSKPEALIAAAPYHINTVLTDDGIQFADLPKKRRGSTPASVVTLLAGSVFCTSSSTA